MSKPSKANLFLVIMAGGSGTRFWPKSTARRPKQLLSFGAGGVGASQGQSLLRETLRRFDSLVPKNQRLVVTTELLVEPIREDAGPGEVTVLAEPQGRNTAPCIYWAAQEVFKRDRKGVMLVMPADHFMSHPAEFSAAVAKAADWAFHHDDLVTLGVQPMRAETGYGYLKTGKPVGDQGALRVEAFVEKPNLKKAEEFVASGDYFWNGGMFLWRADVILKAFDTHMPEMKRAWDQARGDAPTAYPKLTATSIDYGVMEKANNVVTFPLDCGWDDVGSWTSLEGLAGFLNARKAGNIVTAGETVAIDSQDNIVDVPGRLVALLGVNDLIIVQAGESLLVASKERAQDIRLIVDQVKKVRPDLV